MFRLNPLAEFLVCSRSPIPSSLKCREQTLIKQFGSHDPLTLSVGRGTHPWDVADGDVKQKFVTFPLDVPTETAGGHEETIPIGIQHTNNY